MLVKFILAFSDTLEDKLTAQHNALQGINYTFLFSKCLLKYPTFLKCVIKNNNNKLAAEHKSLAEVLTFFFLQHTKIWKPWNLIIIYQVADDIIETKVL